MKPSIMTHQNDQHEMLYLMVKVWKNFNKDGGVKNALQENDSIELKSKTIKMQVQILWFLSMFCQQSMVCYIWIEMY